MKSIKTFFISQKLTFPSLKTSGQGYIIDSSPYKLTCFNVFKNIK